MKNPKPAISVIIPMYKVEPYIRVCVDSVLNQTFQDFEIIIVDDASPDNCYEICRQTYGNNDKVKIVRHKQNQGLGPARNTGMKHAIGKYIYFLDSDDLILSNALEILYDAAEKTNSEIVHMSGYYETIPEEHNDGQLHLKPIWEGNQKQQGYLNNDLRVRMQGWKNISTHPMTWLNLYRMDFLKKYDLKFLSIISEDEPFAFACYCFAKKFFKIPVLAYVYRKRENSITLAPALEKFPKAIHSMIVSSQYLKQVMDKVPDFSKDEELHNFCFDHFYENLSYHYIYRLYNNANVAFELDGLLKNTFQPFFKDNTDLIKHLFHGYYFFRQRLINLANENRRILNLVNKIIVEMPFLMQFIDDLKHTEKRVLFLSSPQHGNLGDQAIVLAEDSLFKSVFPEYKVLEIPTKYFIDELRQFFFGLDFERYVKADDIVFIHGGGNLGNIWPMEEEVHKDIINRFPNNKIVIFPQSIHFTNDEAGRIAAMESSKIYNAHNDLHLICRDEVSFGVAKNIFPNVHKYLTPDSVTLFQGILDNMETSREGVLFVLRRDKEKVRNDQIIQSMQNYLNNLGITNKVIDTVINEEVKTEQQRKEKVFGVLREIRQSKLVITDRFHGVIFSVVTKTPVLAFKSYDTKISSGIQWFRNLPNVFYAENKSSEDMKKFIDSAIEGNAEEWNDEINYEKILIDTLETIISKNN